MKGKKKRELDINSFGMNSSLILIARICFQIQSDPGMEREGRAGGTLHVNSSLTIEEVNTRYDKQKCKNRPGLCGEIAPRKWKGQTDRYSRSPVKLSGWDMQT